MVSIFFLILCFSAALGQADTSVFGIYTYDDHYSGDHHVYTGRLVLKKEGIFRISHIGGSCNSNFETGNFLYKDRTLTLIAIKYDELNEVDSVFQKPVIRYTDTLYFHLDTNTFCPPKKILYWKHEWPCYTKIRTGGN